MSGNIVNTGMGALVTFRDSSLAAWPAFSQAAGAMLFTAIWQSAVVAACLGICLKLANRISAALRFHVWLAGLLAVASLPFLPLLLHLASAPALGLTRRLASGASDTLGAAGPWLRLDIRWSILLTILWAAASLYRAADLAVHSVRLRRLWKTAKPLESNWTSDSGARAPVQLWGRRPIQVCTTNALDRPSVIGFLAPRILIPEWLYARLSPEELDQILIHETEHLRRCDDWSNLLQKLILIAFPLNPVLVWIERQLCLEREMSCDEAVIRVTHAPRAYAACLTRLAEQGMQRRAEALSLGAWQRRPELVRRVHSILLHRNALGSLGARGVFAALVCGLMLGSVELARCPQLIAFAPSREAVSAQPRVLAQWAVPSGMPARTQAGMVDTEVVESVLNNSVQRVTSGKPDRTEPKAKLAMRARSSSVNPMESSTGRNSAAPAQSREVAGNFVSTPPRQELLQAERTNPAPVPVQERQAQGWMVLTTWEEVSTVSQGAGPADASGNGNNAPSTEFAEDPSKAQPTRQITVTRLIFRVAPPSSTSTLPTAVPIRGGWLVIQL